MACTNPIPAWRARPGSPGGPQVVFDSGKGLAHTLMYLPCGQCIACRMARARTWAIRCMHEAYLSDSNCFVTLTYDDSHLTSLPNTPAGYSLDKRHMQLFFKRLRERISPQSIRYYQCGEYGDLYGRPHHHALLFGWVPPDLELFSSNGDIKLYTSSLLTDVWTHGYVTVGMVTFDSAMYVASYCIKRVTGDKAIAHYQGRQPEYVTMSRRPGIGKDYYTKYKDDLYNHDKCIINPNFITKPPKYYDTLFELDNPDRYNTIKERRKKYASLLMQDYLSQLEVLERKDNYLKVVTKQKQDNRNLKRSKRNATIDV